MMDVGFIGLGTMGSRIAGRLVNAGHRLRVWNRSPAPVDALVKMGARRAADARDAFSGDVVISMLADDAAVHSVIDGLIDGAPKGLVHVNMSTISIALAHELGERHSARGLLYVAAPVFGRPDLAADGKLNVVVAGDPSVIARIEPLFDVIGQKTWRIGAQPERANVVKLCSNLMLGAAVEAMAEASALGMRHGIEPADLLDVLTNSVFTSPVDKTYGALISERRYEPAGFRLALLLKDVRLALAAADAASVPMPLADVVHESLLDATAHGDGQRDVAALARVALRRAAVEETSLTA